MTRSRARKYLSILLVGVFFITIQYGCRSSTKETIILNEIKEEIEVDKEEVQIPIFLDNQQVDTSSISSYKPLTELEIRRITLQAKNIMTEIVNCLNFDGITMINENGRTFAISNKYKTRDQVFNALYDYYTDDAINEFLENYTLEKDGVFYIIYGQGGVSLSIEEAELTIEQNESNLKAIYTEVISEELTVRQEYNFIKYDNVWIRSDITLYS